MAYTNSSLITYTNISPNKTSPRNHIIDTITIHCIVGQWTAKQGCDYFTNPNRNASCNYVVGKDGSIGLCVEEKDRSWCSSSRSNDHRAITIEVASDTTHPYAVTDAALNALIKLCADICQRNNIKQLVWSTDKNKRINHSNGCNMTVHRDFENKACPGEYLYSRHGYIADEVNKLLGAKISNTTSPIVVSVPLKINQSKKSIQEFLNTYYGEEIKKVVGALLAVDGDVGPKSKLALGIAIQVELNKLGAGLIIDGKIGPQSAAAWNKYVGILQKGSNNIFVTLWQCILVGFNYNPNGIDGIFGNGCLKATNQMFGAYKIAQDSAVSGADINKIL